MGAVHGNVCIGAATQRDLRTHRRVGGTDSALEHTCCCKQLRAMTNGSYGFVVFGKVLDDLQYACVQAQVFGRTTTRNNQGIVVFGFDFCKGGVQYKVVPRFFAVGLVAFKIMDSSAHKLTGFLVRAYRMHRVSHHQQSLKGHHDLIIFSKITNKHQDVLLSHSILQQVFDGLNIRARIVYAKIYVKCFTAGTVHPMYSFVLCGRADKQQNP